MPGEAQLRLIQGMRCGLQNDPVAERGEDNAPAVDRLNRELVFDIDSKPDVRAVAVNIEDSEDELPVRICGGCIAAVHLAFELGPDVIVVAAFFVIEGRDLIPLAADSLRVERGDLDLERYALAR